MWHNLLVCGLTLLVFILVTICLLNLGPAMFPEYAAPMTVAWFAALISLHRWAFSTCIRHTFSQKNSLEWLVNACLNSTNQSKQRYAHLVLSELFGWRYGTHPWTSTNSGFCAVELWRRFLRENLNCIEWDPSLKRYVEIL